MPKLNVQQNNQNVIQSLANGVAIGRLNGIIACDGANNFSVAEAGGGGGRNLLDNPWFTVNQRGQSSYGQGAIVDRWINLSATVTITVTNDGLTLPRDTSSGIRQKLEPSLNTFLIGKNVVFSVLFQDGTIAEFPFVWSNSHSNRGSKNNVAIYAGGLSGVSINRTQEVYVRAVKLELGSVSTLANDAPPNDAEELAKCNFYEIMLKTSAQYGYLGYGIADSATSATILIPLPNNMRDADPTITTNGTIAVKGGTSGTHTITGITFKLRVTGGVLVTVATAGLTTGEFCLLQLNNTSSYINLSAPL